MQEPSPRASRLVLAGALAAVVLVGGAGFLLGRGSAPEALSPAPVEAPQPDPSPTPAGILGRADLISLAAEAADAFAGRRTPGEELIDAGGRRFELRLPFGCEGPAEPDAEVPMRWRYDREDETLRIVIAPVQWSGSAWLPGENARRVEAIEGFWIEQPWTSNEACPALGVTPAQDGDAQDDAAEPEVPDTAPTPTLAIGQVFLTDGPRRGRRDGSAYEAVLRVPPEELDPSQGFRLRISGRLARGTGAAPITCSQAAGGRQRPVCLISTIVDEVAIENGASGETLAEWSTSGRAAPVVAPET